MATGKHFRIEVQFRNSYGPNDWQTTLGKCSTAEIAERRAARLMEWGPGIVAARVLESRTRAVVAVLSR